MIKFGFIGCGKASRFHADSLLALGQRINAVAARPGSKNIKGFAEYYHVAWTFDSWQEMVSQQRPDALIVAVAWDQTENIIQDVVSTGIPCLVEKPVALSAAKLQKIMDHTQRFHKQVMVGYNRRFYDFIPIVQQALREQELISIELNFPEAAEALIKIKSGKIAQHILVYMSSHWLDLVTALIGKLKLIWIKRKEDKTKGYITAYNGILESLRYNVPLHLQANFNAPSNTSISFNFRDSIYKICPMETLTVYEGMEIVKEKYGKKIKRYIPKVENTFYAESTHKPGFLNQMRDFIDCCVTKTKINTRACTLAEALSVTQLCEKIKNS